MYIFYFYIFHNVLLARVTKHFQHDSSQLNILYIFLQNSLRKYSCRSIVVFIIFNYE